MRNAEAKNKISSTIISLFIVGFLLIISLFTLFIALSLVSNNDYYVSGNTYYNFKKSQNDNDFSYKIDILSIDGKNLPTNNIYIDLDRLVDYDRPENLTIAEFNSTKGFIKKIKHYSYDIDRIPQEISFSITLSISITYFDSDDDKYLSMEDYFIIKIIDLDKNEPFNLSKHYYTEFTFLIFTTQRSCGSITLNERPIGLDEFGIMSSSNSSSISVCLLIFGTICIILIVLQISIFIQLLKNKGSKT